MQHNIFDKNEAHTANTRGIKNCRNLGYSSVVARFNYCVT